MILLKRNRILRSSPAIRSLVAETRLTPDDMMAPLFVVEGESVVEEIASMPGYFRRSVDMTVQEVKQ